MTRRIFQSICVASISVFLASAAVILGVLYDDFSEIQMNRLRAQTELAAQGAAHEGAAYFRDLEAGIYRITWIGPDGAVLYDTGSDAAGMDSHLGREEIAAALRDGYGESVRYSDTLTERLFYTAKRLPDGSVLRLADTQYTVWMLLAGVLDKVLIVAGLAVLLSLFLAFRLSKSIVKPLNDLNLDEPADQGSYPELRPVLERIASQQRQLKRQALELRQRQAQFNAAADNMNEGLILLNGKGIVLSVNHAASRLLGLPASCAGEDILAACFSTGLKALLEQAKSGEYAQTVMRAGELEYQINASPIVTGQTVAGIVLLIFDITEKQSAEQMRREFTANVSHELKTPLHSISGYAELLKEGLVKPEDIAAFSERIWLEAQRMIALVGDIISLSHLDEGTGDVKRENVDLYELAESMVQRLKPKAEAAGIRLTLCGSAAPVYGVLQLISSIIFNLCDNAIQYNRAGGEAEVRVFNREKEAVLSVRDTGIGIPAEHQERVFERFYRVDKSHSREIGGTGLGLSIVKHAARLHHARIELESAPGRGTTVTVRFPKEG